MLSLKPNFLLERETHKSETPLLEKGDIEMKYINTESQLADSFTKPLDATYFASLQGMGGTWCLPSL
jgi:hypothetical protein